MVTASSERTLRDMGQYVLMDISHGAAGALGMIAGGLIAGENILNKGPGDTIGSQNFLAATAAFLFGLMLFVMSSSVDESTGDYMAAASLGAFVAAVFWAVGLQITIPGGNGSTTSQSPDMTPSQRRRRQKETNSWADQTQQSPRSRRREQDTWG